MLCSCKLHSFKILQILRSKKEIIYVCTLFDVKLVYHAIKNFCDENASKALLILALRILSQKLYFN